MADDEEIRRRSRQAFDDAAAQAAQKQAEWSAPLGAGTSMDVIVGDDAVERYLSEHGLQAGNVPIEAALMQRGGTNTGQPAVMLVINVDGKKRIAKTTLRLLEVACRAMRTASGIDADGNPLT